MMRLSIGLTLQFLDNCSRRSQKSAVVVAAGVIQIVFISKTAGWDTTKTPKIQFHQLKPPSWLLLLISSDTKTLLIIIILIIFSSQTKLKSFALLRSGREGNFVFYTSSSSRHLSLNVWAAHPGRVMENHVYDNYQQHFNYVPML